MANLFPNFIVNNTSTDPTKNPQGLIPEIVLTQHEVKIGVEPIKSIPIEKISQLLMFQSGDASTSPTHSPRNFYEQIIIKDSGSVRKLWIWGQKDAVWRNITLT